MVYSNDVLTSLTLCMGIKMISYNKLWKRLIDCGLKKTDLTALAGISTNVMAKLGKNETVSMESLLKICKVLSCDIGDVMEIKDEQESESIQHSQPGKSQMFGKSLEISEAK